jgi:hypothetical protein
LGYGALLERYVSFTGEAAEHALDDDVALDMISHRLWGNAHGLGASLRRRLGIRTHDEALRAARVAYGIVGIDLHAVGDGDVAIERCAFADRYSPRICGVMAWFDAGLIAGLTGGGRLTFSERITEGMPRCLARIRWSEAPP